MTAFLTGAHAMRIALAALVLATALGGAAQAQDKWPSRNVTIVVPFAPGGLADIVARPLAAHLEKQFKQPFIVVNRGGAGSGIGIQSVAKAPADGYTLLVSLNGISTLPAIAEATGKPGMFTREEFAPIARIVADPCVIFVQKDAPWKSAGELIADAKNRPDAILYSSSGVYGPTHLPTVMLELATGTKLRHLPTTGGGPAMQALLAGSVHLFFTVPALAMEHVGAGLLRPLAASSPKRLPVLPDVPTLAELGFDVEYLAWAGLFTAKDVPAEIRKSLDAAVAKIAADSEFREGLAKIGNTLAYQGAEEFGQWWEKDSARLSQIIHAINAKQ
ncbi:MAG TPA: tripartite tricarboxylate transporter substrate binding protein [Hyphomicrobiaceae bacterium]|jgi:tripartite-type tricarboxylate transporter receptor subunit TctC|nr:tripartite tricarboxylate transporter substrate binding protein [Hyphomicrobiaceae bacterium]